MFKKLVVVGLATVILAGCDTQLESLGLGAAVGGAGAALVGGSVATGVLIGAGAGYLCDNGTICK